MQLKVYINILVPNKVKFDTKFEGLEFDLGDVDSNPKIFPVKHIFWVFVNFQ